MEEEQPSSNMEHEHEQDQELGYCFRCNSDDHDYLTCPILINDPAKSADDKDANNSGDPSGGLSQNPNQILTQEFVHPSSPIWFPPADDIQLPVRFALLQQWSRDLQSWAGQLHEWIRHMYIILENYPTATFQELADHSFKFTVTVIDSTEERQYLARAIRATDARLRPSHPRYPASSCPFRPSDVQAFFMAGERVEDQLIYLAQFLRDRERNRLPSYPGLFLDSIAESSDLELDETPMRARDGQHFLQMLQNGLCGRNIERKTSAQGPQSSEVKADDPKSFESNQKGLTQSDVTSGKSVGDSRPSQVGNEPRMHNFPTASRVSISSEAKTMQGEKKLQDKVTQQMSSSKPTQRSTTPCDENELDKCSDTGDDGEWTPTPAPKRGARARSSGKAARGKETENKQKESKPRAKQPRASAKSGPASKSDGPAPRKSRAKKVQKPVETAEAKEENAQEDDMAVELSAAIDRNKDKPGFFDALEAMAKKAKKEEEEKRMATQDNSGSKASTLKRKHDKIGPKLDLESMKKEKLAKVINARLEKMKRSSADGQGGFKSTSVNQSKTNAPESSTGVSFSNFNQNTQYGSNLHERSDGVALAPSGARYPFDEQRMWDFLNNGHSQILEGFQYAGQVGSNTYYNQGGNEAIDLSAFTSQSSNVGQSADQMIVDKNDGETNGDKCTDEDEVQDGNSMMDAEMGQFIDFSPTVEE
ncbi:hypothetical protein B7463_g356, partial [Scytalidium lignicola]